MELLEGLVYQKRSRGTKTPVVSMVPVDILTFFQGTDKPSPLQEDRGKVVRGSLYDVTGATM